MIRCPKCGTRFDYREAVMDQTWREIIALLPRFGSHGKLAFEYIEKFDTNPLKAKSRNVLRLLKELSKLYESESFKWRKNTYSISKSGVLEAVQITCNKNFSEPLENHNYLKKVMITIAGRELKEKRDRLDREQRERESAARQAIADRGALEPVPYHEWAKGK